MDQRLAANRSIECKFSRKYCSLLNQKTARLIADILRYFEIIVKVFKQKRCTLNLLILEVVRKNKGKI